MEGQTIEAFEADLGRNLYRIWNRMSSGSYFPPPVRAVPIPKKSRGQRSLGVPTVSDRIAQMVVKQLIEPSYGYRPAKSALDAVGITRGGAGNMIGFWSLISKVCLTTSRRSFCSRQFAGT
ncbi:reverse transcriptase domain-containing protein (plasmid) [Rhizobium etli bv. mimosae str. Mim1]|nr:reverse transcriptase domain-containing protein [Rhizobium etli bv. mimosae str. Mim1]